MTDPVSKVTFESEGYEVRDWTDPLGRFYMLQNAEVKIPEEMNTKEYFEHQENQSGSTITVELFNGLGFINLDYSPYLRTQKDTLFVGSVSLSENLLGSNLNELDTIFEDYTSSQIEFSGCDYIESSDFSQDLPEIAYLKIPEGYNESDLAKSTDAAQSVIEIINEIMNNVNYDLGSDSLKEELS
jgi:hypothetical protein